MTDEPEQKAPTVGEALAAAVAAFEAQFALIDDHYMHTGQAKTAEGVAFINYTIGASDVPGTVQFTPQHDHAAAIKQWVAGIKELVVPGATYLAWRLRPHFEAYEGGFLLVSRFSTGFVADLSEPTRERLQLT